METNKPGVRDTSLTENRREKTNLNSDILLMENTSHVPA